MQRIILYILLFPLGIVAGQKADYSLLKAKAQVSQYKYNDALQAISDSKLSTNEAYMLKAFCYYQTNDFKKALTNYLKADSISENSSALEIAKCYASLSETKSATLWLEKHLRSKYKLSEYEIVTNKAFDAISNSNEWKTLWKKEWYTPSDIVKSAIKAQIKRGNLSDALNNLDNNRNIITPKFELYYLEALIYKGLKQMDAALTSINLAIEGNNRNQYYFILKSEILKTTGNYSESLNNISFAIEINPNEPSYYINRAEVARLAGNNSLAQTDLDLYKQLYPEASETLYQLGMLESAKGNYLNAIDYFSKLIIKEQNNPTYYIERGETAYKAERFEMADNDMAAALDINPNLERANLLKGKLRLYFSDKEVACYYFEKAATLGNKEAAKLFNENCGKGD